VKRTGLGIVGASIALVMMLGVAARLGLTSPRKTPTLRMERFPRVMLWAWERPEDLSFLDPHQVGVAYLASSLYLNGDRVAVRPRQQPLKLPSNSVVVAVVRIETDWRSSPTMSPRQRRDAAAAIASVARFSPAAIQIDFDARRSQRAFYRDLLGEVRSRLPASMPLTINALASWCLYDNWIADLPIDEAVPMLFRLGRNKSEVADYLRGGGDFAPTLARQSFGVALDEPGIRGPAGRRVYIFSPRAWTRDAAIKAIGEVAK
jgi:hypothetical protein